MLLVIHAAAASLDTDEIKKVMSPDLHHRGDCRPVLMTATFVTVVSLVAVLTREILLHVIKLHNFPGFEVEVESYRRGLEPVPAYTACVVKRLLHVDQFCKADASICRSAYTGKGVVRGELVVDVVVVALYVDGFLVT